MWMFFNTCKGYKYIASRLVRWYGFCRLGFGTTYRDHILTFKLGFMYVSYMWWN